jgi:capsular polysaccharide biosynthesis protein
MAHESHYQVIDPAVFILTIIVIAFIVASCGVSAFFYRAMYQLNVRIHAIERETVQMAIEIVED